MILDLAIGDAWGACFECVDQEVIDEFFRNNRFLQYREHPTHDLLPGNYTDDAQMASVVAEVMLTGKFTREALADGWVRRFKEDKRPGYTHGFYNLLDSCKDGAEFLHRIRNDSIKSGAAMRAPPIGLYKSRDEVKKKAKLQAEITHTDSGVEAAIASALMVHYFVHEKGPRSGLRDHIAAEVDARYSRIWQPNQRVSSNGGHCVSAAIYAVMDNNNIPDLLRQCVQYGGDTDTVAAIAMAAASCSSEYREQHEKHGQGWSKRLPVRLHSGLEPEFRQRSFGREYLKDLDGRLFQMFT